MSDFYLNNSKIKDKSITDDKLATDFAASISSGDRQSLILLSRMAEKNYEENEAFIKAYIDPLVRAGTIPIPFQDDEVERICLENYDTDGDGELSYSEAQAVKSLTDIFYNNTNIKNFNELRYFNHITSIWCPDYISDSGRGVFKGCTSLESIELPSTWTYIQGCMFSGCTSLRRVILPNALTELRGYSFYKCISLVDPKLPNGVTTIRSGVFQGCTNFAPTSLPDSLEYVAYMTFGDCTSLALTELPSGLTTIGANAFNNCTSLALTELPSGLTTLERFAFTRCINIKLTALPDSLTKVGVIYYAYQGKIPGVAIDFSNFTKGTTTLTYANGCLYDTTNNTMMMMDGQPTKIIVPEGITNLVGGVLFYAGQVNTKVVDLPSTLTKWDENPFYGANQIAVICRATTPPTVGQYWWRMNVSRFYVPDDSIDTYKAATGWSEAASTIYPLSEYNESDWITE